MLRSRLILLDFTSFSGSASNIALEIGRLCALSDDVQISAKLFECQNDAIYREIMEDHIVDDACNQQQTKISGLV
jgi:hypothetical protein